MNSLVLKVQILRIEIKLSANFQLQNNLEIFAIFVKVLVAINAKRRTNIVTMMYFLKSYTNDL